MQNYEIISDIGNGAFGTVHKCKDKTTGELVAIKQLKTPCYSQKEWLEMKEVKSLRKIRGENVVKLLKTFLENQRVFLVFELLDQSLLKSISQRSKPFCDGEVRYIMKQALEGLNTVHKQGFFHRDIKPDNFIWKESTLKIADFGLAREIRSRPPYTDYLGTRWYRAPELLLRTERYNSPIDIWALGVIMGELYTLNPLFQGEREMDQLFKIFSVVGTPSPQTWPDSARLADKMNIKFPQYSGVDLRTLIPNACPEAISVIHLMLTVDPLSRPSANDLLRHEFFQGKMIPYSASNQNDVKVSHSIYAPRVASPHFLSEGPNPQCPYSTGKSDLPSLYKVPGQPSYAPSNQHENSHYHIPKRTELPQLSSFQKHVDCPILSPKIKFESNYFSPKKFASSILDPSSGNPNNYSKVQFDGKNNSSSQFNGMLNNPDKSKRDNPLPEMFDHYSVVSPEDQNRPKIISPGDSPCSPQRPERSSKRVFNANKNQNFFESFTPGRNLPTGKPSVAPPSSLFGMPNTDSAQSQDSFQYERVSSTRRAPSSKKGLLDFDKINQNSQNPSNKFI